MLTANNEGCVRMLHLLLSMLQDVLSASESSLVLPHVTLAAKRAHLAVTLQQGLSRAAYEGAWIGHVAVAGPCVAALAETELIDLADVKVGKHLLHVMLLRGECGRVHKSPVVQVLESACGE
jgi:hypothetical protein